LGAGLGVVELTVALHYVFDTPNDKLIWDVGHQAYPHKIVTGRRDRIRTIRQGGGLSGFTKRSESEYDPFGAAHSSTSISAALGFAIANKLAEAPGRAVALIGDGALSAGMAYEAMNNAAAAGDDLVRIGLMADIPDQFVVRRVEHIMDRDRQLDDAQAGAQMATGHRDGRNHFLPELVGKLRQLILAKRSDVSRILNPIQQRRGEGGPHRTSYPTFARSVQ